ncbi:MAG: hypothetical protein ACOH15_04195 [Acetobacterium sp.]
MGDKSKQKRETKKKKATKKPSATISSSVAPENKPNTDYEKKN